MKKFLLLIALCAFFAGCSDDTSDNGKGTDLIIDDSQLSVKFDSAENSSRITFTANKSWTATVTPAEATWCTLSTDKGVAGQASLIVLATANSTGDDRTATIILTAGDTQKSIEVEQPSADMLSVIGKTDFIVSWKGGDIEFEVKSNLEYTCTPDKDSGWLTAVESAKVAEDTRALATTTKYTFRAAQNNGSDRTGTIVVSSAATKKEVKITVTQVYESTNFSADGMVTALQTATEGNGINLILMGDAFSDRQIADKTYENTMRKVMDMFFSQEPYTEFRHLFNVYMINGVSKNESYFKGAVTKFEGTFSDDRSSTIVSGNFDLNVEYAKKAPGITSQEIDRGLIIVIMNKKAYAGTTYLLRPTYSGNVDYGGGRAIAYFPLGTDDEMFRELLLHEAGGHGFAKLGDEYFYEWNQTIPDEEKLKYSPYYRYGWYKNFTFDKTNLKWSKFIADDRYKSENLGAYEGACYYTKGAWRPTDQSIMRSNKGAFNAPSREAIYYRIHKLAYGDEWTYDYETFVQYDLKVGNIPATPQAQAQRAAASKAIDANFIPLPPPVILE